MLLFELTKDTPYLALSGEIWSVFYEYFNRNWSCYKGFLLYVTSGPQIFAHVDFEGPIGAAWPHLVCDTRQDAWDLHHNTPTSHNGSNSSGAAFDVRSRHFST